MPVRSSSATWEGDLRSGNGQMRLGSGAYEGAYTYASRFEEAEGSNPEELIAAAHAGCYAMALSGDLAQAGHEPDWVDVTANVYLEDGSISRIVLEVDATVPGIDIETFLEYAREAKETCPVSQALAAVPQIDLDATLNN